MLFKRRLCLTQFAQGVFNPDTFLVFRVSTEVAPYPVVSLRRQALISFGHRSPASVRPERRNSET